MKSEASVAGTHDADDVGGAWKGTEAANLLAGIASTESGKIPEALKPAIKCAGFSDLSHSSLISPV